MTPGTRGRRQRGSGALGCAAAGVLQEGVSRSGCFRLFEPNAMPPRPPPEAYRKAALVFAAGCLVSGSKLWLHDRYRTC